MRLQSPQLKGAKLTIKILGKMTPLVAKRIIILSQLEKQYSTMDQEGPEINTRPARIINNNLLKEKADDEKVNDIRKCYGKP